MLGSYGIIKCRTPRQNQRRDHTGEARVGIIPRNSYSAGRRRIWFERRYEEQGQKGRTGLLLLANIQRVVLRKVTRQSPNSVHPRASTVKDWRHLWDFVVRSATGKVEELCLTERSWAALGSFHLFGWCAEHQPQCPGWHC